MRKQLVYIGKTNNLYLKNKCFMKKGKKKFYQEPFVIQVGGKHKKVKPVF